jgi:hypothetical protein
MVATAHARILLLAPISLTIVIAMAVRSSFPGPLPAIASAEAGCPKIFLILNPFQKKREN